MLLGNITIFRLIIHQIIIQTHDLIAFNLTFKTLKTNFSCDLSFTNFLVASFSNKIVDFYLIIEV